MGKPAKPKGKGKKAKVVANTSPSSQKASQIVGNQLSASLHERFNPDPSKKLGATEDGQSWAVAALDPCHPTCPINVGMPDTVTAAVCTPNYRAEEAIVWEPLLFNDKDAEGMKTWGCEVVRPPIPEIEFMYRLHNETNDTWSRWRVVRTSGMELPNFGSEGTAEDFQGKTLRTLGYMKQRIIAQGMTIELDAPDISNQGRIVSGQLACALDQFDVTSSAIQTRATTTEKPTLDGVNQGGSNMKTTVLVVPATAANVVQTCPRAYQALAKEGAYIISKFDGPLIGYDFGNSGGDAAILSAAPIEIEGANDVLNVMTPQSAMTIKATNQPDALVIGDAGSDPLSTDSNFWEMLKTGTSAVGWLAWNEDKSLHPFVSDPSRLLTSVTFFTGLSGGTGDTAAIVPTIRVKTHRFLECLAVAGAGVAPFAHPAPMLDLTAIERVVMVMQKYDDAYPACYNDFGNILNTITSVLGSLGLGGVKQQPSQGQMMVPYNPAFASQQMASYPQQQQGAGGGLGGIMELLPMLLSFL